jgi:glycosyltransferase involved in cell wall biosynthesis
VPGRLLLDVGPAVGGDGSRGIGRYVRGLVRAIGEWSPERQERVWAVGLPGPTLDAFGGRGIEERPLGIRPVDLGWLLGPRALGRAARKSGASVFHATDPHRPWRPRDMKLIVMAYDLIPLLDTALLASWRPHHRLVYKSYLRQLQVADTIVAISRTTAADLATHLGISDERVRIVYPAVRRPATSPRSPASEPTFLYVGALDSHKQPELAVQALAHYREREHERAARLRFIGPSSQAQRNRLLEQAGRFGIADHLQFDGWIPDAALDAAFSTATALLLTSRIEGFGLPAVEAALRGIPVIAVDTPAARETVGTIAMLTPQDAEAIAAAMASPRAPDAAALEELAERFSTGAAADALASVYEAALL